MNPQPYTDTPRYIRCPEYDRRIRRGDDFAGDAWLDAQTGTLRWVVVGYDPNHATTTQTQPKGDDPMNTPDTSNAITIGAINTRPEYDPYARLPGVCSYSEFWLDPRDRTCGISQGYRDGATPIDVYNGHVLTRRIDAYPNEEAARQALEGSADLLRRVCDGYTSEWNGNSHVGRFTDDALHAWAALCAQLDSLQPYYVYWETGEWIQQALYDVITADSTDAEIAAYAAQWAAGGELDGLHVVLDATAEADIIAMCEQRRADLQAKRA